MQGRKLGFFIAGVQKGGTTALHSILRRHPQIALPDRKELHFFDDDAREWTRPDYSDLERHTADARGRLRGEATPIYTYWPHALERLHAYNPAAKLIILLRHPAYRAFSHWRMEVARGKDGGSFHWAISQEGRERVRQSEGGVHRVYSYVERGFYRPQVQRLLSLFAKERVLFLRTDHMWQDVSTTVKRVQSFLEISPMLSPSEEYVVPVDARHLGSIPRSAREALGALFHDDIVATAQLTGLDLSEWTDPRYEEPMKI